MINPKYTLKLQVMVKRLILTLLLFISIIGTISCKDNGALEAKVTDSGKYRYTITHSFRKVDEGEKVKTIYFAVPRTNEYQEISNYHNEKGQLLEDTLSNEYYIMWDVSDNMDTESGDWFSLSFEFDYIPTASEYQLQIVDEIYPYDTTSDAYLKYIGSSYEYIVLDNPEMIEASREIWSHSTNIYDYAKNCLEYINTNFSYKRMIPFRRSLVATLENGGGDCGSLARLFITLCRIKKIPARIVVFQEHVWAEFYLERYGWIPVDPTFNLFGRASSGYSNQIAWANHMVSCVIDPSGKSISIHNLTNRLHFFIYTKPANSQLGLDHPHEKYDCDIKMSKEKY